MSTMRASVITTATLRVAGEIPTDISLNHLGTREQQAGLRLSELLIYVRNAITLDDVLGTWAQNRPGMAALPYVAGTSRLHLPIRLGLVGMIVRLEGTPRCLTTWQPGHPGTARPPHVRVELGPVVFEVCDQAAWHTLGRAWRLIHRHLTPEIETNLEGTDE